MEKLVLRGIMYGADKIPDSWFDKVPGGFYKQKERERQQHEKDGKRRSHSHRHDRLRRRRHSDEYDDRRRRYDEDPRDGARPGRATERRSRHDRNRSSYDGGADYDSEDLEGERSRRARRRTVGDNDRYGYDDGFSRPKGARHSYAPEDRSLESSPIGRHRPSQYQDSSMDAASKRGSAAAAASAGTAAAIAQQGRHASVASPPVVPITAPAPDAVPARYIPASYVPYANIYGPGATHPQVAPQAFSPPPPASASPIPTNNVVPGVSPIQPHGYPAGTRMPASHQSPQSRQRDSYVPSHSPAASFDSDTALPERTRSERQVARNKERSHGSRRFVNPRIHGSPLPPPPTGPPPHSGPFGKIGSTWQEIYGRHDDRRTSEWARGYDRSSRRSQHDEHRSEDEYDDRGHRSD